MRLFAALPIPDEIAQPLLGIQHGVPGARWRPRENFHITLCFFGEIVDPVMARELDEELARITAPPLCLTLGAAGIFGGREPRALWIGFKPNPALESLATACKHAAQRLGIKIERKTYIPHITLAYCRGTLNVDAARFMEQMNGFAAPDFEADSFALYRSHLGTDPASYVPQAKYMLDGS